MKEKRKIEKDDAKTLDKIMYHCLEYDNFTINDYKKLIKYEGNAENLTDELDCLATFIKKYNAGQVLYNGSMCFIKKSKDTVNFMAYGGFENEYKIQEQELKDKKFDKNISIWILILTIISILIGLISLFV